MKKSSNELKKLITMSLIFLEIKLKKSNPKYIKITYIFIKPKKNIVNVKKIYFYRNFALNNKLLKI